MPYNIYPAVDENYNFPKVIKEAFTNSQELIDKVNSLSMSAAKAIPIRHDFTNGSLPTGMHSVSSPARLATLINAPSWLSAGDVIFAAPGVGFELVFHYNIGQLPELYYRSKLSSSGGWSGFVKIGNQATEESEKFSPGQAALSHKVRQDFSIRRLGGTVGTSGRAAVSLRFDDNPRKFIDVILPVLKKYDLVGYLASANRYYDETGVTYSEMQGVALNNGIEIANHSSTHGDSTGDNAIYDNTVGAADSLESKMPQIPVDTWTMPSLSGTKMDGYNDGRYPANFSGTTAGRLIMGRHSAVNGYSGGRTSPLIGHPTVGQTHLTYETMTATSFKNYVIEAQNQGTGLTLMAHPSRIGTPGYMDLATFDACMAWLASEKAAGRLLILTAQGLAFADASSSIRPNFWPQGLTPPTLDLASNYTVPASSFLSSRGAVMELVIRMKGESGGVFKASVKHDDTGLNASKQWTLTNSDPQEFVIPFTLPLLLPYNGDLTINFGRGSTYTGILYDIQLRTT